jgi:hypothetical protein
MDSPNTVFATYTDALILQTEKLVTLQTYYYSFRTLCLYPLNTYHTEILLQIKVAKNIKSYSLHHYNGYQVFSGGKVAEAWH